MNGKPKTGYMQRGADVHAVVELGVSIRLDMLLLLCDGYLDVV